MQEARYWLQANGASLTLNPAPWSFYHEEHEEKHEDHEEQKGSGLNIQQMRVLRGT
jgi:hypothetical protein